MNKLIKNVNFFDYKFFKKTLKMMLAIIFAQIILSLVGFLDIFMINSYGGAKQLHYAAVGIGAEVWFFFQAPMIASTTVFGVFYAQYKRNKNNFTELAKINMYFVLMMSVAISCFMYFGSHVITNVFFTKNDYSVEDSQKIMKLTNDYLKVIALGNLFIFLSTHLINPLIMIGKAKYALYLSVISLIVNAVFNGLLIYVANLGAIGAAWATTISYIVQLFFSIMFVYHNRRYYALKYGYTKIHKKIFISVLKRSYLAISSIIMMWGFVFSSLAIVMTYGAKIMKSLSIAYAISGIMFSILPAIRNSVSATIGRELGKSNFEKASLNAKRISILVGGLAIGFSLLSIIIGSFLPYVTINDTQLADRAKFVIYIFSASLIGYAFQTFYSSIIEISGKQLIPSAFNYFSTVWIHIPLIFIGGPWVLNFSFENMYMLSMFAMYLAPIILYIDYRKMKWLINLNHEIS